MTIAAPSTPHPPLHTAAENLPITECNEMLVYSVALTVSGARVACNRRVIGVRLVENAGVIAQHRGVAIGNVSKHECHSMQYLGTGHRKLKRDAMHKTSSIWRDISSCVRGAACFSCIYTRGGGLGSRPKKMYGERLGDGVEYHLMRPTPRC